LPESRRIDPTEARFRVGMIDRLAGQTCISALTDERHKQLRRRGFGRRTHLVKSDRILSRDR